MIINENQLNSIRKQLGGKRVVVVCGIYDLLHVGHIRFLQKAKELGDILIVGTPRDDYIKTFKGANRPINSSEERAELLNSLESVDYVIEGDSKYISLALQSSIKPDFHAYLEQNGVSATIRRSRGKDIDAACGQLANKG